MIQLRQIGTMMGSALLATAVGLSSAGAQQTPVNLAQAPLFLLTPVKPSLILAIDDSGSMDSEVLIPTNDGAGWWNTNNQSFVGLGRNDELADGRFNFNEAGGAGGGWKKYTYVFPIGTGTGNRIYNDATNDHFAVPPIPEYGWARSPDFNNSYFNPAEVYAPWPSVAGFTFEDVPPTAAPSDIMEGTRTINLTQSIESNQANWQFRVQSGMQLPIGTRYNGLGSDGWTTVVDISLDVETEESIGITYFPATFYLSDLDALPEGFGYTAVPVPHAGAGPGGETLYEYRIEVANFASTAQYDDAIQNFANWFTYYRNRHSATRAGIGEAFQSISNMRVGAFTINNRNNVTMRDLDVPEERSSFFDQIYNIGGNSAGTPNREAVLHMGRQFERTDSDAPVVFACQRNYGVLFTDGYANAWTGANVGNVDGDMGSPFADNVSNTMADIAANFYVNNIRPDLEPGRVPVNAACNADNPDPSLNCQSDPHMSLFGVTLGVQGNIFGVDEDATADPYNNPPEWPTVFQNRNPSAVDDLWHATLNTRGELLDVNVPADMGEAFGAITDNIARQVGSAASIGANSTRLDTETRIFQARFNSNDWSGELIAFAVNFDGSVGDIVWEAGTELTNTNPAGRNIVTVLPDGSAANFTWGNIEGTTAEALFNTAPNGTTDGLGEERVAFLRGDRSNEGGPFRARGSVLGDVVNSDPAFVSNRDFGYASLPGDPGLEYNAFRDGIADRPPMVYVGANDGMLHGFNAETGASVLSFIPSAVYPGLPSLTDPDYAHRYFVDGAPTVADVYVDANNNGVQEWRTVLVGTQGAGGRSIFALDVTDPDNFSPDDVLWEFEHPELGQGVTDAAIVPIKETSGNQTIIRWVAVFGNGYNSEGNDSRLFMVDIETGELVQGFGNFPLLAGTGDADIPNGMAPPLAIDSNGDRFADRIYVGDLRGNVWKFRQNNQDNWVIADASPFFRAERDGVRQPITSKLDAGRNPDGNIMVFFGTGKYLEQSDAVVGDNPPIQSFYAVIDQNLNSTATRTNLLEQEIEAEIEAMGFGFRVVTQNEITNQRGWYMDLESPVNGPEGERVVSRPIVRGGRVIFTTLIPSQDPCDFGGTGWLMEVDAFSGGRLDDPVFDINEDGSFDEGDFLDYIADGSDDDRGTPPSGIRSRDGIIPTPAIISAGEIEYKFLSGSSGNIQEITERGDVTGGRQSWRQLR